MMKDAILNFPKQFAWEPEIENEENLKRKDIVIAAGMGGSHLAADIAQAIDFSFDIVVHSDYGLSGIPESVLKNAFVIVTSYSGNTEEALSAFEEAVRKDIPACAISIGGKLLELAKAQKAPYIQIPNTGIQPRMGVGFMLKAFLKLAGKEKMLTEASELAMRLNANDFENQGRELSQSIQGKIPVIYVSERNRVIAYNWKIKLNETGKIPAFYNTIPELNHNEMTGFSGADGIQELNEKFFFVLLKDSDDDPRNQKRAEALQEMYQSRGLAAVLINLKGSSRIEKIFHSLLTADWVALNIAQFYGSDPEYVPIVEEFKKLIV